EMQKAANAAIRTGTREYDKRHGWRGADRNLIDEGLEDVESAELPDWKLPIRTNDIVPGIVLDPAKNGAAAVKIGGYQALLTPQDIAWTKAKAASDILKRGDVALFMIRSMNPAERKVEVSLEQKPNIQAAFVAIQPQTGEVKTMAKLGVQNLIPYVRRFGITSRIEPVLPIALGAADVTLMEMVSAYSTFPNDGVRVIPQTILRVTDYEDNVLEENLPELRDVIPAETARIMVDLMQEPVRF